MKITTKRIELHVINQELQDKVALASEALLEGKGVATLAKDIKRLREELETKLAEPDLVECDLCKAGIDQDNDRFCYITIGTFFEKSATDNSKTHYTTGSDCVLTFCVGCATRLKGEEL